MYCRKCGNKLEDDALFCSKCGTKINEENENIELRPDNKVFYDRVKVDTKTENGIGNARPIIAPQKTVTKNKLILLVGVVTCICLIFVLKGILANTNEKTYEAYLDFYREFYDNHVDNELSSVDCGGQILINDNGEPILAICNLNVTDNNPNVEVYLYEYKDGEVREITRETGIETAINGLYIDIYDGKITMCTEPKGTRKPIVYVLEENGFVQESTIEENVFGGNLKENKYNEFWGETKYYTDTPLFIAFYSESGEVYALNGSRFESLLRSLASANAKTILDVKKVYTDYFGVHDINRHPEFVYVENDLLYCYNADKEQLLFEDTIGESEPLTMLNKLPKEIEDIEVELGSNVIRSQIYELKLEDIESVEYDEQSITIETKEGQKYKLATRYSITIASVYETKFKVSDVIAYPISVEEFKEYFDAGKIKGYSLFIERLNSVDLFLHDLEIDIDGQGETNNNEQSANVVVIEGDKSFTISSGNTYQFEIIDNLLYLSTGDIYEYYGKVMSFEVAENCEWYTCLLETGERIETFSYEEMKALIDKGLVDYNSSVVYTVKCEDGILTDVYIGLNKKKYFNESAAPDFEEPRYDVNGNIIGYIGYEYDDLGNEIKILSYDVDGNVEMYVTKEYYEGGVLHTYYNAEGIKESATDYFSVKTGEDTYTLYYKVSYDYDVEGNVEYYHTYEYDESYRIIKTSSYHNGELESYYVNEYWDNGNTKKSAGYNAEGKLLSLFEYDENGEETYWEYFE